MQCEIILKSVKTMLYRKIEAYIEKYLKSESDKILIIEGARQVGKSFIIREVGSRLFKNFVEINFAEDYAGMQLFKNISTTESFYLTLSSIAGDKLDKVENTLVFIDEIQQYPMFLTMLKFLRQEHRYTYIASGSLLGLALRSTTSIPIGSIVRKQMYQLDFEEFLIANGFGNDALSAIKDKYLHQESLDENLHSYIMKLFHRYLLVGGMPDAINEYLATHNIVRIRDVQNSIYSLYGDDAAKYAESSGKHLLIKRIYDMVPSQMENKKKRIIAKEINNKKGDRLNNYNDEFEYLIGSGIAIDVHAISNPHYPLAESARKNLIKLYLSDIGLLTSQLYHNNIQAILNDECSINLGSVYESVVAQELKAHSHNLFYYDNRQRGEVDFIIDDYYNMCVLPVEVKSGKGYTIHSALNKLLEVPDYHIKYGLVLYNKREIKHKDKIVYMPIYYSMFIGTSVEDDNIIF